MISERDRAIGYVSYSCSLPDPAEHERCFQHRHVCSPDEIAQPHCACACHEPRAEDE